MMLVIAAMIVMLLPKSGSFQYEYQLGSEWRYDDLIAPFDFPIYKSEADLEKDKEKILENQVPIFNFNKNTAASQLNKFNSATERIRTSENDAVINTLQRELERIYERGIIQVPEQLDAENLKTIKIVEDNVGKDVDFKSVYTPTQAYATLVKSLENTTSEEVREQVLGLNLNNYLQSNLDFDLSKTNSELSNQLKGINFTQGMVHQGENILNKGELVTPEKLQILNSLKREYRISSGGITNRIRVIIGLTILILASMTVFSIYFYYNKKRIFFNNKDFIFLYGSFFATILMGSLGYYQNINMLAIPVLFFVIIVNILKEQRSAFYLLLGTSMLLALFSPHSYMYLFMQLAAGMVTIYGLAHLQRRGQLLLCIFLIFLTYVAVYAAFILIQEGEIKIIHAFGLLWILINCFLLILTYPVIYIFERIFGFVSEITLIELSNPNHPALRALTKKAPGTFQHSLMVANLAEEAIYRIGGNPLLTRTGAMYHDIGKTYEPVFFIENQVGGLNPHSNLEFDESARHILDHVTNGVEMAKKYNLPEAIVDFIRTHHGKSKVKYFYNSFKNKYPDQIVDESAFTYAGPDPTGKE
ncbi:MAG: HDIG domain-containing protein, partial [Odoribacter sp.]|nr:HDIG domain-containing protein [Odoribacter sp.]